MNCLLGLGTNQGDRVLNLTRALDFLKSKISSISTSSIYESKALLPKDTLKEWDINYLNMVIYGQYSADIDSLFAFIQNIEKEMGRNENRQRWSPRIIDIDILIFSDSIISNNKLQIPHPDMLKRLFVMLPASEVAKDLKHPLTKMSIGQELQKMDKVNDLGIRKYRESL